MTLICDTKIDINVCEPYYINFLWTTSIVQLFDFMTPDIFHLVNVWGSKVGKAKGCQG